jgi:hypothetical protein
MIRTYSIKNLAGTTFGGKDTKGGKSTGNSNYASFGTGVGSKGDSCTSAYMLVYDRQYKGDINFEYETKEQEEKISGLMNMNIKDLQLKRKSSKFLTGDAGQGPIAIVEPETGTTEGGDDEKVTPGGDGEGAEPAKSPKEGSEEGSGSFSLLFSRY